MNPGPRLDARHLPPLPASRDEMVDALAAHLYGRVPQVTREVTLVTSEPQQRAYAGKATHHQLRLSLPTPTTPFTLPVTLTVPDQPAGPAVLLVNFGALPHDYCPIEELVDAGLTVCVVDYQAVTSDDDDFSDGLAGHFPHARSSMGKIALWAWAASRVLDHLSRRDDLDPAQVWVAGHSRLGKTALWAAAQDERFAGAISNDSGCSGAALTRGNTGEQVSDITGRFGHWFLPGYADRANDPSTLPLDQHWLLAAIAPRRLCVGSAIEDDWADPLSEYLACVAASPAWERHGAVGLGDTSSSTPTLGNIGGGRVQYHLRPGTHFLSRQDWMTYLAAVLS
ncbi:glucuronyl esterase domain-containing protein [Aestuariimicrobium ganziense]|uniref:glucuronyl esterase domain-containing protein n=1 Tax=Aestuariimicrobium ganziense TaxID=2773677 RepID=UPI0019451421|nr:hypothetical protein [Aestuariimicrobium ganziense]